MTGTDEQRRFDELAPFYVSGALDAADRAWVDAYLAREPGARAALEWHQALARTIEERYAQVPADVGRAGLERRLAADRRGGKGGLLALLERLVPRAALYPAFAGAAALVLVQVIVIGVLVNRPDAPEYAEVRSLGAAAERSYLQVSFKPAAAERDIRLVLIRVGGQIVHGPGQLGDYYLAVPAGRIDAAHRELEASAVVEAVARVTKLPPREE